MRFDPPSPPIVRLGLDTTGTAAGPVWLDRLVLRPAHVRMWGAGGDGGGGSWAKVKRYQAGHPRRLREIDAWGGGYRPMHGEGRRFRRPLFLHQTIRIEALIQMEDSRGFERIREDSGRGVRGRSRGPRNRCMRRRISICINPIHLHFKFQFTLSIGPRPSNLSLSSVSFFVERQGDIFGA
jgi:hypothetical protein